MKERPILFSALMVRALLAGTKTQTRRVVKPQPDFVAKQGEIAALFTPDDCRLGRLGKSITCPYGQPGDRLWVRESWAPDPPCDGAWGYTAWAGCRDGQIAGVPELFRHPRHCLYAATWEHDPIRWTPSIHMPRWASRITLEIVSVRVERLQDISEADAKAEGIVPAGDGNGWQLADTTHYMGDPVSSYASLWESIDGPGSWDANPWVWVVEFRRVTP